MANQEHVAKLLEGVEGWNAWREKNGGLRPDLARATLYATSLRGANLDNVDLTGALLAMADLGRSSCRNAELRGADLRFVQLENASLQGAKFNGGGIFFPSGPSFVLRGADLTGANITGANLDRAVLDGADLSKAVLRGASLHETYISETLFIDTDLTAAKGLESCIHGGPSTIDYRTLAKSGPVSVNFLRGCGLPETQITSLRSMLANDFYSCFISYSGHDQIFADRLHADLQNKGVRCWFAPHDVRGGRKLHEQLDEAIRVYDRLLLILSVHSMNSEWVKTEIANARQKELSERRQVLFPVSLEPFAKIREWKNFDADTGKDSAREIREYFIPDFSNWKDHDSYHKAFERLVRDLKAKEAGADPPDRE